ncbi:AAA family ATPase [Methylosinus sp. H3A]|nr:AAA family ATPase [Methylosinus sp. H3A]
MADIKSERWPASDRNRWPASYWNAWPASSEYAPRQVLRVTNSAQIRVEESLRSQAARAALGTSGALAAADIRRAIEASGLDFDSEPEHGAAQKAAIYALGQGGALSLLTGVAGAGKSTLLQPLVAAWKADTRFDASGRELVGVSTAWRQADALQDAGIAQTRALEPFLKSVDAGEFMPTRNTILIIDEISQIAPRPMLRLLELQAETGMTIKALAALTRRICCLPVGHGVGSGPSAFGNSHGRS